MSPEATAAQPRTPGAPDLLQPQKGTTVRRKPLPRGPEVTHAAPLQKVKRDPPRGGGGSGSPQTQRPQGGEEGGPTDESSQ